MNGPFRFALQFITAAFILMQATTVVASPPWQELDTGLQMAAFSVTDAGIDIPDSPLIVLRIDPSHYQFELLTSTERGRLLTPAEWATQHNLTALINASMYLPDHRTSTGYLRSGTHLNNDHVNKRFGSFFVASPNPELPNSDQRTALPEVAILDRQTDDWENTITHYRYVAQNFRMINASRTPLWPVEGDAFSIAAVAQDSAGQILFIHCRAPLTVHRLTSILLALPLNIEKAMYVEGGPQASLRIQTHKVQQTWSGKHAGDFWSGSHLEWQLPNVLGIRKK